MAILFPIVLAAALIVFAILAGVTTYWQAIIALPASAAAFLGALSGAGGGLLAIVIGALFNAELNRRRDDRLRRAKGRSLALSLRGEMLSVVDSYNRHQRALGQTIRDCASVTHLETYRVYTHMGCSVAIFSKCSDRLGLLEDPDLIANLAQFYTSLPAEDVSESFRIEKVKEICQSRIAFAEKPIERAEYLAKQLNTVAARLAPPS